MTLEEELDTLQCGFEELKKGMEILAERLTQIREEMGKESMQKNTTTEKIKWAKIATSCVGTEYGHVPGHSYSDVEVKIEQLGKQLRLKMYHLWGQNQGHDEENGRSEIVCLDTELNNLVKQAEDRGRAVEMPEAYMIQALTQAQADAFDVLANQD